MFIIFGVVFPAMAIVVIAVLLAAVMAGGA